MNDFGNGLDFNAYIMFKPLENIKDKTGSFKIGGAYDIGNYHISYNTYSVFALYDTEKFHIRSEYLYADGYNGVYESGNKVDGFYTVISYDLTPKLSVVGRYDYFLPNKLHKNNYSRETTVGVTYKPFKNMKVMLNLANKNNSNIPDSNMILFATRFFI